tara:strand:- start:1611 stop:2369 length:759 start_codon:yes stop_codon:yes gene_type:complete
MTVDYLTVEAAKNLSGLRLVLTAGVPGPWSESAKALFRHHQVPYSPVRQEGGRDNPELVAWTKHRNAPIALYNDEAPRVRWLELLDLAERLGQGPSLVPGDRVNRMLMVGLVNEIAGDNGFAWNARLLMLNATFEAVGDKAYKNPMLKDYQFEPDKVEGVKASLNDFLAFLGKHIAQQDGPYLVGGEFTAADLYWAYFSNLLQPQDPAVNPMPGFLRKSYELSATLLEPFSDALIVHRDLIFAKHLQTPLTF